MCCEKRKTEIKKYENYKEEKMHTSELKRGKWAIQKEDESGCEWKHKIVLKEVDKVNGEKVENCNTIKDRTGKLVVAKDNVQKT